MPRRLLALAVVAATLVVAPAASAVTITGSDAARWQTVANQAPATLPDWITLNVKAEPCPASTAALGCLYTNGDIYLQPIVGETPRVFLHELGHAYGHVYLRPRENEVARVTEDRAHYAELVGGQALPWENGTAGPQLGEWFAESYEQCALDSQAPQPLGDYGYAVSAAVHQQICAWLPGTAWLARDLQVAAGAVTFAPVVDAFLKSGAAPSPKPVVKKRRCVKWKRARRRVRIRAGVYRYKRVRVCARRALR